MAFADFVDIQLSGCVTHVNNQEDPVPIVPPEFLGFRHPSGEIHILDSGAWDACPGAFLPPAFAYGSLDRALSDIAFCRPECRGNERSKIDGDALIEQYARLVDQLAVICSKVVFDMMRNAILS